MITHYTRHQPYTSENIILVVSIYSGHTTTVLYRSIYHISGENKIICFFRLCSAEFSKTTTFTAHLPTIARFACNLYYFSSYIKHQKKLLRVFPLDLCVFKNVCIFSCMDEPFFKI